MRNPLKSAESKNQLSALTLAQGWLNTEPLTAEGLQGKVVLVDFWTYTCVNWLRTLPYVRAWAQKYKNDGLVVVGVHSPEFEFEKNVDNVRRSARDLRVDYPVAIDSDLAIWEAFHNQYWPALYFIDAHGKTRNHHFGEGEYARSEKVIQDLLLDAGHTDVDREPAIVHPIGAEVAADWGTLQSGENYVGYFRTEHFASPGGPVLDERQIYDAPAGLRRNEWALFGAWTMTGQKVALNEGGGRIAYGFHARDVNVVMGPPAAGTTVRFRILVDGRPPAEAAGGDIDAEGGGTVSEQRMYQLIRQPGPIEDRRIDIEFLDPGVEIFVFTFG